MDNTPSKTGVVEWFHEKKGFGFIVGDDAVNYFFHRTALTTPTIEKGQAVEFEIGQFKGKPVAIHVRPTTSGVRA